MFRSTIKKRSLSHPNNSSSSSTSNIRGTSKSTTKVGLLQSESDDDSDDKERMNHTDQQRNTNTNQNVTINSSSAASIQNYRQRHTNAMVKKKQQRTTSSSSFLFSSKQGNGTIPQQYAVNNDDENDDIKYDDTERDSTKFRSTNRNGVIDDISSEALMMKNINSTRNQHTSKKRKSRGLQYDTISQTIQTNSNIYDDNVRITDNDVMNIQSLEHTNDQYGTKIYNPSKQGPYIPNETYVRPTSTKSNIQTMEIHDDDDDIDHDYDRNDETDILLSTNTSHQNHTKQHQQPEKLDDDYIPLYGRENKPISKYHEILSGDDAFDYIESMQQHIQQHDETSTYPSVAVKNDIKHEHADIAHNDDWENEIIRRAGISKYHMMGMNNHQHISTTSFDTKATSTSTASATNPMYENHHGNDIDPLYDSSTNNSTTMQSSPSNMILNQLRTQIMNGIEKLNNNIYDTERSIERQKGEIIIHQNTIQQQEQVLHTNVGKQYEFYQQWRNQYIIWIGALSELQNKVVPILQAYHTIEHDKASIQLYDQFYNHDIMDILHEHHVLDYVIGTKNQKQSWSSIKANTSDMSMGENELDEFGRIKVSQSLLERDKRRHHRKRIYEQRRYRTLPNLMIDSDIEYSTATSNTKNTTRPYLQGDESDGFISDGEEEGLRERHEALQSALSLALNEIDDEYKQLHKLLDFFMSWRTTYPEEYTMQHASHILMDLATILIQVELCSLNDPWNESGGYNEAKWIVAIHNAMNDNLLDISAVERLFDKCIIPIISDIVLHNDVNILSSHQARSICTFINHLRKLLPSNHPKWIDIHRVIMLFVISSLDNITVPVLRQDYMNSGNSTDNTNTSKQDEYDEAIYSATHGLLHRMKKILDNIFIYWVPLLLPVDKEFRTQILDFLLNKFIIFISSMNRVFLSTQHENDNGLSETPMDVFKSIYQRLLQTGWLDLPEHMAYAVPIRAAAIAYYANISSA